MKTIYKKIVAILLICTIISCAFQTSLFAVEFIENVSSITKASNYFEADEIIPNPNYVPTQNQTDVNSVNSNGSIANGVYRIKNVYNGKYVDTNGGGTSAGTALVQWDKSEFINGNPDVPNRNQLFKITYLLTVNGLDYYSIRPMRNNGMGVSAPITGTVRNATIQSIPTTDYYNSISNLQRWAITKNGSYYTIKNGASSINSFLATPANTVNGSNIITSTDSVSNNSKWILEPFTGGELYGTAMTNFTNTVAVGKTFTYQAVMYSSTTGHNGPVTYSVRNPNGTATDKATINSTTGELTALKEGSIQVVTSYPNAPYLWLWNVEIQFEEGSYFIQNRQTEKYMQPDNNGGNFMEQHSFDGANDQRWSILYDEDYGYYKIRNLNSGLYLTVQNNTNTDENIIEQPFLSSTADRQLWRFTKISDNTYKIQAKSHEGTDLVIALGAGIESANGINIEQRDYADDGNYKDEWFLHKHYDYECIYIGAQDGDPLMGPILSSVESKFNSNGYYGEGSTDATVDEFIRKLCTAEVFSCITHGSKTLVQVSDNYYVNQSSISSLSNDAFDNLTLVYYGACETGAGGPNSSNLVNTTYEKGADVVIGFSGEVLVDEANYWTEIFMKNIADGFSVQEAMSHADDAMRDHPIFGNRIAYTVSLRHIRGNVNLIPCP